MRLRAHANRAHESVRLRTAAPGRMIPVRALGSARLWGGNGVRGVAGRLGVYAPGRPAFSLVVVLAHTSLPSCPTRLGGSTSRQTSVTRAGAIPPTCRVCGQGVESTGRPCIEPGSGQCGQG